MSDDDWAKNLWSIANAITTFAVVQGLAFGYVLGKSEIKDRIKTTASRVVIVTIAILALAFYCVAIYRLGYYGSKLDAPHAKLWNEITIAQIVAVIFFTSFPLLGLLDDASKGSAQQTGPKEAPPVRGPPPAQSGQ